MSNVTETSVPYFVYDGQASDIATELLGKNSSPGFYMVLKNSYFCFYSSIEGLVRSERFIARKQLCMGRTVQLESSEKSSSNL